MAPPGSISTGIPHLAADYLPGCGSLVLSLRGKSIVVARSDLEALESVIRRARWIAADLHPDPPPEPETVT